MHGHILAAALMLTAPAAPGTPATTAGPNRGGPEAATDRPAAGGDLISARIGGRLVKSFDFDERPLGNFEAEPMHWNRIVAAGFPRFLKGGFDEAVGHAAPPSFRLGLMGGSIGFRYRAKDIPVDPGSDYRVTAWIRPQGLNHAAAFVTVYYLDPALRKIAASERRSTRVRGPAGAEPWTRVIVDLPGGFPDARWIGLSCRIEQPPEPANENAYFRPIHHHDVHAAAWFDDISVMRLPRVTLQLSEPSHVFDAGQPVVCRLRMLDRDGAGLSVVLDLLDAAGEVIRSRHLHGGDLSRGALAVDLGNLPAGLYHVRLSTRVGRQPISTHERTFLRLNPPPFGKRAAGTPAAGAGRRMRTAGRGFGVIADDSLLDHAGASRRLLERLSPRVVKMPIWRREMGDEAIVRGDGRVDGLVDALQRAGIGVVGVLDSVPESLATQYDLADRSLFSILASDPNRWRPYLALLFTRHGHRIHAWQVGGEDAPPPRDPQQRARALANVRAEMAPLIGRPELVVTGVAHEMRATEEQTADILSIRVPPEYAADRLADQLAGAVGEAAPVAWATLSPPQADRYARRWRLIEFARRLITARTAGIETVFIRQPWRFEEVNGQLHVIPTEEFILFRTLCQALGDLAPAGPVPLGRGVRGRLFKGRPNEAGVLAVWATGEAERDARLVVDLGKDTRQLDLWGNMRPGEQLRGGTAFAINALPTLLCPVEPWRVEMLSAFALDAPLFQPTVEEHERVLSFTNTRATKLNGVLRLEGPPGWRIRPKRLAIDLPPGQSAGFRLRVRLPTNQAAGDYELLGRLSTEDEDLPELTLRTPLVVGAPGLDVNVAAYRDGDGLSVVQRITNRSSEALRLRAYLLAPGRPRDVRLIQNLPAGRTTVRQYRLENARLLSGRHLRVSVEQVDGPLRYNTLVRLE